MPPHMTGNMIMTGEHAMENIAMLIKPNFGIEIIYSFVIILASLMIYFATKELYTLSGHKGLKYFRLSFLFFALAYFFRSFIKFTLITVDEIPLNFLINLNTLTFMLFIYASTMAIFYLLYSVIHKKFSPKENPIILLHTTAIIIAILTITLRSSLFHIIITTTLLALAILTFYISKSQKKKNSLHWVYALMAIFWTLQLLDILIPNFLRGAQIIIYLASLSIFLAMLYKVLRKVGPK